MTQCTHRPTGDDVEKSRSDLKPVLIFILAVVVVIVAAGVMTAQLLYLDPAELLAVARVELYYARDVNNLCEQYNLPPSYFKALIILESSGYHKPRKRFEQTTFTKLQQVRDGERHRFGSITKETVQDASDDALRNLATSWGPLQIMGYHCVGMGVLVKDLRDSEALKWSIIWAKDTYGNILTEHRYEDAFHIHNTGSAHPEYGPPLTHDPTYVDRGTRYIRAFQKLERFSFL